LVAGPPHFDHIFSSVYSFCNRFADFVRLSRLLRDQSKISRVSGGARPSGSRDRKGSRKIATLIWELSLNVSQNLSAASQPHRGCDTCCGMTKGNYAFGFLTQNLGFDKADG